MNLEIQERKLRSYYKWHAPIYDVTRWSFLFGRQRLIKTLPDLPARPRILEVGCGTGRNLPFFPHRYPDAQVTGIDLSLTMLQHASRKTERHPHIQLLHGRYGSQELSFEPFDLIFLSYAITMMGTEIIPVLQRITNDLKTNGHIAVVDFHQTSLGWFQQWMKANHVLMDGSVFPLLQETYRPVHANVHAAYLGFWSYFLFVGKRG